MIYRPHRGSWRLDHRCSLQFDSYLDELMADTTLYHVSSYHAIYHADYSSALPFFFFFFF
jgi:hypothetical protein